MTMTRTGLQLAIAFALFVFCIPAAHAQKKPTPERTISVSGTSEVRVAPDQAILIFGIDTQNKDLNAAKFANDGIAANLMSLVTTSGVEQKNIQTSQLEMRPEYSTGDKPVFLDFNVSQSFAITVTNLSKVNDLLTGALKAGVNRVDGITFMVADPRKYRDQARTMALQSAREKAVAMGAALGQTIGKPLQIEELQQGGRVAVGGGGGGAMANAFSPNWNFFVRGDDSSPISGGEIVIRADVSVTFELQ